MLSSSMMGLKDSLDGKEGNQPDLKQIIEQEEDEEEDVLTF